MCEQTFAFFQVQQTSRNLIKSPESRLCRLTDARHILPLVLSGFVLRRLLRKTSGCRLTDLRFFIEQEHEFNTSSFVVLTRKTGISVDTNELFRLTSF